MFYKQDHAGTRARLAELESTEQALNETMERWAELEQLAERQGT